MKRAKMLDIEYFRRRNFISSVSTDISVLPESERKFHRCSYLQWEQIRQHSFSLRISHRYTGIHRTSGVCNELLTYCKENCSLIVGRTPRRQKQIIKHRGSSNRLKILFLFEPFAESLSCGWYCHWCAAFYGVGFESIQCPKKTLRCCSVRLLKASCFKHASHQTLGFAWKWSVHSLKYEDFLISEIDEEGNCPLG